MKKSIKKGILSVCIVLVLVAVGLCSYFMLSKNTMPTTLSVTEQTLQKINEIRNTPNTNTKGVEGTIYYVSGNGDDTADGTTPQTAWQTLSKLQTELSNTIQSGDAVLFRRGDVFRGNIRITKDDILLGSYGDASQPKPEINVSPYNGAVEGTWVEVEPNIWQYSEKINADVGVIWFFHNNDSLTHQHEWSHYSYEFGQKISFDTSVDESNLELSSILQNDLEFYHAGKAYSGVQTGEYVYVYSPINPQIRFDSIEFAIGANAIYGRTNLTVDNLKIVFTGIHGVGTGSVANLTVTNCEFGYIGGARQNQNNVRFGNAIEIYGQVTETNGYAVENGFVANNNYIYEVYDAGITFQYTATQTSTFMEKATITNNVVEKCNYSIEYWNVSQSTTQHKQESYINAFTIENNMFHYSGYGVSQTCPDKGQSAHIKTWVHDADYENKVIGSFTIKNNIFYTSAEQMLAIYACEESSMPVFINNAFYNSESVPLGYVYYKNLAKKIIPYTASKMLQILPQNTFYYTTQFTEQVLQGTSKDVVWELNTTSGVLTISGSGEMQDYTLENLPEWIKYANFVNAIVIGEQVTKLGTYAFYQLPYVEKISIQSISLQNLSYDTINFNNGNNYTFYQTGRSWYGIHVIFGSNVQRIPNFLFWPSSSNLDSPYITSITFQGNNITEIGNHALAGIRCTSLIIPEGVKTLGVLAISNSPSLLSVTLPNSLNTLSAWALAGNAYLQEISIGENIHALQENLFYAAHNLQTVIVRGDLSETSNIQNIFSEQASCITLYGNATVEAFVQRYNANHANHQIAYAKLDV